MDFEHNFWLICLKIRVNRTENKIRVGASRKKFTKIKIIIIFIAWKWNLRHKDAERKNIIFCLIFGSHHFIHKKSHMKRLLWFLMRSKHTQRKKIDWIKDEVLFPKWLLMKLTFHRCYKNQTQIFAQIFAWKVYFIKWKCQGSDKSIWKRNKNPSEISTNSWKNIVEIRNLMSNFFVTHSDWNLCLRSRKNHKSMKRTKKTECVDKILGSI